LPSSLPALAAAIADPERSWPCHCQTQAFLAQPLVPAYRIPARRRQGERISRLADAVALLAERLDRLPLAYQHWQVFDAGAFFDLRPAQLGAMLRIERLGATLDVTLHADLLSPAFRSAERFWAQQFCPAYYAAGHVHDSSDAFGHHFGKVVVPAMQRRLEMARSEIAAAGNLLYERAAIVFLVAAAAPDERERHVRQLSPGDEDLAGLFHKLPCLTLSRSFDLLDT
jgi:hypothetical protein